MSIVTATARAKTPEAPQRGAGVIKLNLPISPAEAWAAVAALRIGIEWYEGMFIATYRDRERNTYLPVPGETAFAAVVDLLMQLSVEVVNG